MKKIGLVGGTGPESTLMYYRELNSRIDKLTSGQTMPELSIESVDFYKVWKYVADRQYEPLVSYLAEKVHNLVAGGAEVVSLTAATMHIVFDALSKRVDTRLVSIPVAIRDEVIRRGYKKVGLLGTLFTMEQDYMKKALRESGIEIYIPEKEDRELVAVRIYEELEHGIVKEATLAEFQKIIGNMREKDGIEAVILGCTELPLLLNKDNCTIPCIDSVEVHIQKLIDLAMA